jgi:DcmR-like sensory protein
VPDAGRFNQIVEPLLDRAASRGRRVVVFGSMVDVLCGKGQIDAAIRLEELWNEVARRRAFSLACGYRMSRFSNARHAAPFVRICSQHSHVFSAGR